jgi:hypothetical protein
VEAYASAIRRGATLATNGPWITVDVDSLGPGMTLTAARSQTITARATASGPGVRHVALVSADGELARSPLAPDADTTVRAEVRFDLAAPTWIAARVIGERHPEVLGFESVAHTTPVYIDIEGERVARATSARWCLDWLDRLERLLHAHGRYASDSHRDDVVAVIDAARAIYREVASRGT